YEERLTLQKLLKEGLSFKKIASQLHKDPSTISREVRRYAVKIATGKPGYSFNACKNRFSCKTKPPALCGTDCTRKGSSNSACRLCRCNEHCPDFVEEVCAVQDLAGNAHLRASGRFGGSGKMFYLCSTDWSVCFSVFGINRRRKALRSSLYSGRIASAEQGDCIGGMQKCCRLSSDVTHRVVSVGFAA
ncbi:MAG: helix-turn-helix domain-containing protein, partial [Bacteroides sp.]